MNTIEEPLFAPNMRVLIIPAGIAQSGLDSVTSIVDSGSITAMTATSVFVMDSRKIARQFHFCQDGQYRDPIAVLIPSDSETERMLIETKSSEEALRTVGKALKEQMQKATTAKQGALRARLIELIAPAGREVSHATS